MTREELLDLIDSQNIVVRTINVTKQGIKITDELFFQLMGLSVAHARVSLALTHEARKMGIDAVCNMQSGEIKVNEEPVLGIRYYEVLYKNCFNNYRVALIATVDIIDFMIKHKNDGIRPTLFKETTFENYRSNKIVHFPEYNFSAI